MCGRYALFLPPSELKSRFGCDNILNIPARYNCAPMQTLPIIIKNRMGTARWGFLPNWKNEDDKIFAAKMINARSESIHQKPTFQDSWFKARRCLIPASGFYEWHKPNPNAANRPHYISAPDTDIMAFAGLWSKTNTPGGPLITFTILTKQAEGPIAKLHHRSPVIFTPGQAPQWFSADEQNAKAMIEASTSKNLTHHGVSSDVGNVKNDTAGLIKRLAV